MELFDRIKHTNPKSGVEYWFARELQFVLDYTQWRRFSEVIARAKIACATSGFNVSDHFADVGKMVDVGSGAKREIDDVALTRYACYLVAQNGDSSKDVIAKAQTYFAFQTRRQELADQFTELTEDERRIAIRAELRNQPNRLPLNLSGDDTFIRVFV
jgi:DNA-damage-inducible protein D